MVNGFPQFEGDQFISQPGLGGPSGLLQRGQRPAQTLAAAGGGRAEDFAVGSTRLQAMADRGPETIEPLAGCRADNAIGSAICFATDPATRRRACGAAGPLG